MKFIKLYKSIVEKVTTNKQALYIACDFNKSKIKSLYQGFPTKDMKEPELEPHMTLFYSPNAEGYNQDEVLTFLKSALKDQKFKANLTKYKVFKNTEDGTSDCLVVEVDVEDKLKKIRKVIVDFLKDKVQELEITFPQWKPHMTIGYYELGEVPKYEKFEPVEITLKNFFCRFGDSSAKKYNL